MNYVHETKGRDDNFEVILEDCGIVFEKKIEFKISQICKMKLVELD
jgi:hypothetical protein